ncbi:S41 family peptidase [Ferruginibacter sp. SUN106]|uniref:S41 family peptidase n=1 Tax=Ferruginibacter sp. SUN106 TaxID=2978348 RepID=UPI003D368E15
MNKLVFIFTFCWAYVFFAKAQETAPTNKDVDFIIQKIKTVYAGYDSTIYLKPFKNAIKEITAQPTTDTLSAYSKLTALFNDQHLALYELRLTKNIDLTACSTNITYLKKAAAAPPQKNSHEGYWINDINTQVIFLKYEGRDEYSGYLIESDKDIPAGYKIIKLYKNFNAQRNVDYTDPVRQFRTITKAYFKNSTTFFIRPFSKWYKIKNYNSGYLGSKKPFIEKPSIIALDSNNVLVKMHDFSSRGVARIYDSLITANKDILANCKNLIIDIRNNAGGTINNFFSLLPFFGDTPIVTVGAFKLCSQDLIEDALADKKFYASRNDTSKINDLNSAVKRMEANKGHFIYLKPDTIIFKKETSKIKNVALVINHGCRSAAELMVLYLKQQAIVKTFGESTGGAVDYLDLLTYRLPVTNYIFWVGTTKREITTQQPKFDNNGIKPDVQINENTEDWIQVIKNYYE